MTNIRLPGRKEKGRKAMTHIHGGNVYQYKEAADFSANINFRGMPQSVREAAHAAIDQSVHYPEPNCSSLRGVLAGREHVPETAVICGNGAAELMFALAMAKRPKKAVLAQPCFFEYEQALTAVGCALVHVPLKREDGFRPGADFASQIPDDAELVILGNPNNPTGQCIPRPVLEQVLAACHRIGCMLMIDESFFDFLISEDQAQTLGCAGLAGSDPSVFVLKSFTKMYAMPGIRFGYAICADTTLLEQMREGMQPWNVSLPAQAAARAAAAEEAFAKETAKQTAVNRRRMLEELRAFGVTVYDSVTNYLLFEGPEDLQARCLAHGYLIRDCSNFRTLSKGFYRICIRSRQENEELLTVLKEVWG